MCPNLISVEMRNVIVGPQLTHKVRLNACVWLDNRLVSAKFDNTAGYDLHVLATLVAVACISSTDALLNSSPEYTGFSTIRVEFVMENW